jgi:hypothetical protein
VNSGLSEEVSFLSADKVVNFVSEDKLAIAQDSSRKVDGSEVPELTDDSSVKF